MDMLRVTIGLWYHPYLFPYHMGGYKGAKVEIWSHRLTTMACAACHDWMNYKCSSKSFGTINKVSFNCKFFFSMYCSSSVMIGWIEEPHIIWGVEKGVVAGWQRPITGKRVKCSSEFGDKMTSYTATISFLASSFITVQAWRNKRVYGVLLQAWFWLV